MGHFSDFLTFPLNLKLAKFSTCYKKTYISTVQKKVARKIAWLE